MKDKKKNKPHLRLRFLSLLFLRFALLVGPLGGVFFVNRARYFTTVAESVGLAVGGAICIGFVALLLLGAIKPPGVLYVCGLVFLLSYLMKPILADLFLLSGVAFCSGVVDFIVMKPLCRAAHARIGIQKAAQTTAAELGEALSRLSGRV